MFTMAMYGKAPVGSSVTSIMPSEALFRALVDEQSIHHGLVEVGEESLSVSGVYGADESVMDRRK